MDHERNRVAPGLNMKTSPKQFAEWLHTAHPGQLASEGLDHDKFHLECHGTEYRRCAVGHSLLDSYQSRNEQAKAPKE